MQNTNEVNLQSKSNLTSLLKNFTCLNDSNPSDIQIFSENLYSNLLINDSNFSFVHDSGSCNM